MPCQSSPSTQVTPVTKRLDSMVIEDLTGIREDMDFGHRGNLLVHGSWVFATLRHALEAALDRECIRVIAVEPRGSSWCQ